jgi:hypothetical protein
MHGRADRFAPGVNGIAIGPPTELGWVTAGVLASTTDERLLEPEALRTTGRYPAAAAQKPIATL